MSMKLKLALALMFAGLLMLYPGPSVEAARQAISVWANAYAPAMLPFFIILPVLSSPEAAALYERLFSGTLGALFGCPGRAAGAVILGLIAGSPAGTISLSRLASDGSVNRGQLSRAALLCSGLSPLFLLSGVGVSMLGSVQDGMTLVRSQLGALILCGLIFRWCWRDDEMPVSAPAADPTGGAVREAALNLITVCGYMVFFSVIARIAAQFVGAHWQAPILALIEAAGGAAALGQMPIPYAVRLTLIAFACGFSGLSILMQNASRLKSLGLPVHRLVIGKLAQGLTCALLCAAQLRLMPRAQATPAFASVFASQRAAVLAALILILVGAGIVFLHRADSHGG